MGKKLPTRLWIVVAIYSLPFSRLDQFRLIAWAEIPLLSEGYMNDVPFVQETYYCW